MLDFMILRVAWTSTYTYILLLFAAAAFIAYISRPRSRGEAVKRLFAGTLLTGEEFASVAVEPCLEVKCLEGGKVMFRRLDVAGLTASGAVSVAAVFKGKDVEITERVTPGYSNDPAAFGAEFIIDMTGHEYRHVRWLNEESGLWCAFSLHVRPGIAFTVPLKR